MKLEQAMAIVAQVCAEFKGTLREHQSIQQALQVVQDALDKSETPQDAPQQAQSGKES